MKKIPIFLLIFLPIYILINIYFLDRYYFFCPIEYKRDIIIRNDILGKGHFAASRSGNRKHNGIDLLAEIGTPVYASRSGIVIAAAQRKGMGKYVVIKHFSDIATIYGHLSEILVTKNQLVRQGEMIGRVGKTGNANYRNILPHLHFEVRKNKIPQDPLTYLE